MKKKHILSVVCIILFIALVSCGASKFEITVESPLEFYTPVISSVPGFPLRVILPDETYYGEYKFKWRTDAGKFLNWDENGRITPLGRQAIINDNEIFWTPLEESEKNIDEANLEIEMVRIDGGGVDSRLRFSIVLNTDNLYVLDIKD